MSGTLGTGVIESREEFGKDNAGRYAFWQEELKASLKARKNWHKTSDKIVKRFLDSRYDTEVTPNTAAVPFRLNLFHSNVTTLTAMLYGQTPKVDVSRRFADPEDDVSRVAAEMMERILNNDIAENGEEYNSVLQSTLQDRLLCGLGCARVRYEVELEEGVNGEEVKSEDAPVDYFFWRDVLWGWCRNWSQMPWLGFRSYMTKEEVIERFGEEAGKNIQFKKQLVTEGEETTEDPDQSSPWLKAEIWEIWDKQKRQVVFVALGYEKILETKDDPLQLSGFYPSPPFFLANQTTTLYTPTPDYQLAQDLYNEIDKLQTRIAILTEAVKVVGLYDASNSDVARMFKEGVDNTLIPVENWALFGEKGGLQGAIDWVPISDIVNALTQLRELRDETIALLQKVTGMADVMQGGGSQYEGTGQAQLKAKFGSVRVQALQDQFAKFASDIMQLKAEIISRHFSPETIVQRANIEKTFDRELAPKAVALIKDPIAARLAVDIRPESVAMIDYAQLKMERTDYINSISMFMQSAAPLVEQAPEAMPFLLQLLQWGLAGFKGASEIEGVIDKAVEKAQEAAKQDKPDPAAQQAEMEKQKMQMQMEMQMQQMQAQAEITMQIEQAKAQLKIQELQTKAQADMQIREQDKVADIETNAAETQSKMAEIQAELQAALSEIQAKVQADVQVEQAKLQANITQTQAGAEAETQKDALEAQMQMEASVADMKMRMDENSAQFEAKILEIQAKHSGEMLKEQAKAKETKSAVKPKRPKGKDK